MASPNWIDRGLLAPPPDPKTSVRSMPSVTQSTIMIEPTPEYQRFYNQNRLEMDRQRFELHVAENSLELPHAQPMSRSTTSDSLPSPSTVYSHPGDSNAPFSPDTTTEVAKSKPHRGRRRGPLDMETRTKTAFKRKFKLTCKFHRAKKTSCNCHDFSKLEEAYLQSLGAKEKNSKASQGRSVNSFGELGTFGTGGAGDASPAAHSGCHSIDFPELPTGQELLPHVHPNLLPMLKLDIESAASVNAIVSATHEDPFFIASAAPSPTPMQAIGNDIIAIGCSMTFRNRWECKYQSATEETGSLASTDSCTWTGPFEQLSDHFTSQHHPFRQASVPQFSLCLECAAMSLEWTEVRACREPVTCNPDSWRKWFVGAPPRPPDFNPRRVTVSEASGSRSSWVDPSWNMTTPGSSNTEHTNFRYSSSADRPGFYEHSASGNENNETDSGEGKNNTYHECGRRPNCCRYQPDTTNIMRHCGIGGRLSLSICQSGPKSTTCDSYRKPRPPPKPRCGLALPLLALLIIFHVGGEHVLVQLQGALLAFLAGVYYLRWYIALAVLAPLVAWIAIGSLRTRADGGVSEPARQRYSSH
ncbi:hypothetical protein F4825DRAFT_319168 [Nemania diffusa]|nr:hypothetical protein F4825DRAFT_319168 [Nemania diffusa]